MKFDFNLTHLRYFYDASHTGSVMASAKKNFVTHSAVSQGIKRLEESLGIELVAHKKRQFNLTNEGRFLLRACDGIFASLEHLKGQIDASNTEPTGVLSFASSHSVISSFVLKHFQSLHKNHPLLELKFKLGKTELVRNWVLDRSIEIGVTIDNGNLSGLEVIPLKAGKFVFVSKKEITNLSKIENVLITEPRPETNALISGFIKKYKRAVPVALEIESWELIAQMSEGGHYVGFVPDFVAESRNAKLKATALPIFIPYELVVVHRKGERLSRNAKAFVDQLKTNLDARG